MMLTRVQRRFLSKINKAFIGLVLIAVSMSIGYFGLITLGFNHEQSVSGAMAGVLILGLIASGIKMAWEQSKYEIERETQRVEDALKGKL